MKKLAIKGNASLVTNATRLCDDTLIAAIKAGIANLSGQPEKKIHVVCIDVQSRRLDQLEEFLPRRLFQWPQSVSLDYTIEIEVVESEVEAAGHNLIETLAELKPAELKSSILVALREISPQKAKETAFEVIEMTCANRVVVVDKATGETQDPVELLTSSPGSGSGTTPLPSLPSASTLSPTPSPSPTTQEDEELSGSIKIKMCPVFMVSATIVPAFWII